MELIIFLFLKNEGIEIKNAYARMGIKGGTSAVYMEILNYQSNEDTLYEASCDCSKITEIHKTVKKGGLLGMEKVDFLVVKKKLVLKPLSDHIMLIDLNRDLKENDTITLNLKFKKYGEKIIRVPVKKL